MTIEHFHEAPATTHEQIKPDDVVVYTGMSLDGLLHDDHFRVVERYEALEPYDKEGRFWTCPALRLDDGLGNQYIAPASWFVPFTGRCLCDTCFPPKADAV